jgi:hypothetical protein
MRKSWKALKICHNKTLRNRKDWKSKFTDKTWIIKQSKNKTGTLIKEDLEEKNLSFDIISMFFYDALYLILCIP